MKKTLMILGLGAAMAMFGCSDDSSGTGTGGTGTAGTGGGGGEGGTAGMAGGGGGGGEAGMGGAPAQSGSTIWAAPTTPPGGGTAPTTGGCQVFVTALNSDVFLDTTITLNVASDEAYNVTTAWEILVENPLLGALGNAAQLGALDINAVVTDATGGPINSALAAAAEGAFVGEFYEVPGVGPLVISTPDAITAGSAALTPTVGAGSMFNVNWDGVFSLDLTLAGNPLLTVDESVCAFTDEGTGVDFMVN